MTTLTEPAHLAIATRLTRGQDADQLVDVGERTGWWTPDDVDWVNTGHGGPRPEGWTLDDVETVGPATTETPTERTAPEASANGAAGTAPDPSGSGHGYAGPDAQGASDAPPQVSPSRSSSGKGGGPGASDAPAAPPAAGNERSCDSCGRTYVARRSDSKYCSGACRQRAAKARNRSEDSPAPSWASPDHDALADLRDALHTPTAVQTCCDLGLILYPAECPTHGAQVPPDLLAGNTHDGLPPAAADSDDRADPQGTDADHLPGTVADHRPAPPAGPATCSPPPARSGTRPAGPRPRPQRPANPHPRASSDPRDRRPVLGTADVMTKSSAAAPDPFRDELAQALFDIDIRDHKGLAGSSYEAIADALLAKIATEVQAQVEAAVGQRAVEDDVRVDYLCIGHPGWPDPLSVQTEERALQWLAQYGDHGSEVRVVKRTTIHAALAQPAPVTPGGQGVTPP